jgi:ribosomal 30S subunit maturation factor RimM
LTEGMPILDGSGKQIGTIVQVQRTQDGDIRMVKVRFDGFGRVMVKLVPKFQLKVQGTKALTQLIQAEIERLQDAPA